MSNSKKIILIVAVVMLVVGILISVAAIALVGFQFTRFNTEEYEEKIFTVEEEFSSLAVREPSKDVRILPWSENYTKVICYEAKKVTHRVEVEEDTLKVTCDDRRSWFDCFGVWVNMDLETKIFLPEKQYRSLVVESSSGDLVVKDGLSFESAELRSSSGDIVFGSDVTGRLFCKSSSGELTLTGTTFGELEAKSSSGDIEMRSLTGGSVKASCSSGDISVEGLRVGDTDFHSNSGTIHLSDSKTGALRLATSSGDIRLSDTVAEGAANWESASGDIRFTASDAPSLSIRTASGNVRGEFLTPKLITAHTSSGDIRIPDPDREGGACDIRTASGDITIKIVP